MAKTSRAHASRLLQAFSSRPQTIEDTKYEMELIASLLLCKGYHQDQSTNIGISWTDKMRGSDFTIPASLPSPTLDNHHRVTRATRNHSLQAAEAGPPPQQRSDGATSVQAATVSGEARRSRRRRGPVTPLSMTLRSQTARRSTSREVCGICMEEYGTENHDVCFCVACTNVTHRACGESWMEQPDTCPFW